MYDRENLIPYYLNLAPFSIASPSNILIWLDEALLVILKTFKSFKCMAYKSRISNFRYPFQPRGRVTRKFRLLPWREDFGKIINAKFNKQTFLDGTVSLKPPPPPWQILGHSGRNLYKSFPDWTVTAWYLHDNFQLKIKQKVKLDAPAKNNIAILFQNNSYFHFKVKATYKDLTRKNFE